MDKLNAMFETTLNMTIAVIHQEFIAVQNSIPYTNILGNSSNPSNPNEYDGIFISPLMNDIHNFPLTSDHKTPKFKIFCGEQDPKQYLISF